MNAWRAVIFDLDDTLYPEGTYVLSGFRAVADWVERNLSIPADETAQELTKLFRQGVRGDTFTQWLRRQESMKNDDGLLERMIAVYREHRPTIAPFEGMTELVKELASRYQLGVVSDGYLAMQKCKWEALPFATYFQTVVFSDAFGRAHWKPSSIPFEAALRGLGISSQSAVYVGDNPAKDFFGARRLGLYTIRLQMACGEHAHVQPPSMDHAPDVTVPNVCELASILLSRCHTYVSEPSR